MTGAINMRPLGHLGRSILLLQLAEMGARKMQRDLAGAELEAVRTVELKIRRAIDELLAMSEAS